MENDELECLKEDEKCESCGKPWQEHDGLKRTCRKLQVAIKALKYCKGLSHSATDKSAIANEALEVILGK